VAVFVAQEYTHYVFGRDAIYLPEHVRESRHLSLDRSLASSLRDRFQRLKNLIANRKHITSAFALSFSPRSGDEEHVLEEESRDQRDQRKDQDRDKTVLERSSQRHPFRRRGGDAMQQVPGNAAADDRPHNRDAQRCPQVSPSIRQMVAATQSRAPSASIRHTAAQSVLVLVGTESVVGRKNNSAPTASRPIGRLI
jgi:hypothetical protein